METTKHPVLQQVRVVMDLLKQKTNLDYIHVNDYEIITNALFKIAEIHAEEKRDAVTSVLQDLTNKLTNA